MEWRSEDNKIGLKLGWRSKRKGEERREGGGRGGRERREKRENKNENLRI